MPSESSTPSTVHSPRTPLSQPMPLLSQEEVKQRIGSGDMFKPRESGPERDREDEMMQISREVTPVDATSPTASGSASSPRSGLGSSSTLGNGSSMADDERDVEKFLKKMDMEKKMQALQQRLELASVKATNGWKDMSINEIETKLPPTPLRKRRSQISLLPSSPIVSSPTRNPSIPYEPPSPSRPWQLIDVLWQPLPPPSHGRYPASPTSPRKRSREDPETLRAHLNGLAVPLSPLKNQRRPPGSGGHRRASSSISAQVHERERLKNATAGPSSPLRFGFEERGKKKRSTSHSAPRTGKQTTTSQDVDAAKALTFMLGSGSSGGLSDDDAARRRDSGPLSAPLLPSFGSLSLPIPEAFQRSSGSISPTLQPRKLGRTSSMSTPRPADLRTPSSHARSRVPPDSGSTSTSVEAEQEDKNAAELMMFLAHSPSPMKRYNGPTPGQDQGSPSSAMSPYRPSLGSAARVLFAESEEDALSATLPFKSKPRPSLPPIFTASKPGDRASTDDSKPTDVEGDNITGSSHGESSGAVSVGSGGQVFAPSNLALAPPITPDSNVGPGLSHTDGEAMSGVIAGGA